MIHCSGNKEPFYAIRVPDTDLDMTLIVKTSCRVYRLTLDENTSDRIKGFRFSLHSPMHILDHRAIQFSDQQIP